MERDRFWAYCYLLAKEIGWKEGMYHYFVNFVLNTPVENDPD